MFRSIKAVNSCSLTYISLKLLHFSRPSQMSFLRNQSNCVAVCQMTSKNNKDANFVTTQNLIESAATAGAKVG